MFKKIEEDLHKSLQSLCNNVDYNNWFSHLKIVNVDNNSIEISVPNDTVKDWIEDKLFHILQKSISDTIDKNIQIRIISRKNTDIPKEINIFNNTSEYEINESHLLNAYTFDNFVIGKSNQFAHAAAFSVAKFPGDKYNPLFIYGASGLGKTHLIQAIGNYIKERNKKIKVLYLHTEMFINLVLDAVNNKEISKLRKSMRSIDILLLDDIHFIKRSEFLQDELFNTFNTLHENKKQIVFTSDRLPRDIPKIPERLVSRFQMGLIVDIKEPDFDTRLAILRKKIENQNLDISDEILNYIANNIKSNVRHLEGTLLKLLAYATLNKRNIDIKLAREVVLSMIEPSTQYDEIKIEISPDEIIDTITEFYKISKNDILGSKRKKSIVIPRQICVYLLRQYTNLSLKEIAFKIKRKDHSTIIHSIKKIEELKKNNKSINEDLMRINSLLNVD